MEKELNSAAPGNLSALDSCPNQASGRGHAPIRFIADDRETGSGVIQALEEIEGVTVEIRRLRLGDFAVDTGCAFERKTMLDLAASLVDGRLFNQAHRLVNSGTLAALILEGRGSDLAASQMRREALQGAIISLTLIFGLPVLRSCDPDETARLMVYAAGQLRRHGANIPLNRGTRPRTKRRTQLRILQGLPGVGPARAQQLIERFGSVEAVMTAAPAELGALRGIGEQTAARIRWALTV